MIVNEINPLNGFQIEKYHAGYCVRNPKGEYLWFGSDDGEENNYFFTEGRRAKYGEYSDTKTEYTNSKEGAIKEFKRWMKQELDEDRSIPPLEIYRFI